MTKDKMIYDDARSIGVDYKSFKKLESIFNNDDEQSLQQLMNILTPRMQKQLVDELHNNSEVNQ